MVATRRELLSGLGAGLVLLQGGALAQGGEATAAPRYATVREVDELRREVRDHIQRQQNALARVRRTGFAPGPVLFTGTVNVSGDALTIPSGPAAGYSLPFPGSIIALSVSISGTLTGTPGVDFWTFTIQKGAEATLASVVLDAGDSSGEAALDKGDVTFAPGDRLTVTSLKTGSPAAVSAALLAWVSFT